MDSNGNGVLSPREVEEAAMVRRPNNHCPFNPHTPFIYTTAPYVLLNVYAYVLTTTQCRRTTARR